MTCPGSGFKVPAEAANGLGLVLDLDFAISVIAPVEAHQHAFAVYASDDAHRAPPHRLQVRQRVLGIVDAQVGAVVPVREQQLAAVLEVAVHHLDDGLAEVGELLEELRLHLAELAVDDLPAVALLVEAVGEELLIDAELRGKELVDESDVVVMLAHLEDLLPAEAQLAVPGAPGAQVVAVVELLAEAPLVPAVLDVPPELDAQLVGIDGAGPDSHGAGMMIGIVDDLRVLQRPGGHDRRMPIRIVIDEARSGVAMRSLDGDVVNIGTAVRDFDNLVFPLLLLEPAALRDVVLQRSSLALQAKANLAGKSGGGFTHDVDMPATVFLRTPPAQDAEVEQQQLHLLTHDLTRSAEDDS